MGILTRFVEQRAHPSTADPALIGMFGGRPSTSGVRVTYDRALGVSAILAATRIIAESIASIPLHLYRRLERGRQRAQDHGLYYLLHDRPNPWQTSFEWREMFAGHLVLRGNAYNYISTLGDGSVNALIPLHPDRTRLRVDKILADQPPIMWYEWTPLGGGQPQIFFPDEILHFRGLSDDGFRGLSPLEVSRDTFGSAIATEEHAGRFFANNAEPGGILTHPKTLKAETKEKLRETWYSRHGGVANAGRIAVLEEGLTWTAVGVSNKDAQLLEQRKFTVTEIARLYRIPPHLLGDLEHATFSNIEHMGIEFSVHTIRPYTVRCEQRMKVSLLTDAEQRTFYPEFNLDGFSRGDMKSRFESYAVGRQWGWLSADDVRESENQNPLPEGQGDVYLVPLNMHAAGDPAPAPAPKAAAQRSLPAGDSRSLVVRDRLRSAFGQVFRETVARAVRSEVSAARRVLDRAIAANDVELFRGWLEDHQPQHADFVARTLQPVMLGYAEAVQGEAAYEVNGAPGMTAELVALVNLAAQGAGQRESIALGVASQPFVQAGATADMLASVRGLLADWETVRAQHVAGMETTRLGAEVARFAYRAAGALGVVWICRDEDPYCLAMHNRSASIDAPFLNAGDVLAVDGHAPLSLHSQVRHPPLNARCSCILIPQRSA